MTIFETAANLELWPKILPHYRYIRYLEREPGSQRRRNGCDSAPAFRFRGLPNKSSTATAFEIRFLHLKAWTKGMRRSVDISGSARRRAGRNQARPAISREDLSANRGQDHRRLFHSSHRK